MTVDPYTGEAGAALRNAETALAMAKRSRKMRSLMPWWCFGRRRAMKGSVEFWESEAMRFVALSARIDGDL